MKKILFVLIILSNVCFAQTFTVGIPQAIDNTATPLFKGVSFRRQTTIATPPVGINIANLNGTLSIKDSLGNKGAIDVSQVNSISNYATNIVTTNLVNQTTGGLTFKSNSSSTLGKLFDNGNLVISTDGLDYGDKLRVDGKSLLGKTNVGSRQINFSGSQALLFVSGDYNGTGDSQFYVSGGVSNDVQRLLVGYNTTGDYGVLQATRMGVGNKNIALNPNGGNVLIGTSTDAGYRLDNIGSTRLDGSTISMSGSKVGIDNGASPWALRLNTTGLYTYGQSINIAAGTTGDNSTTNINFSTTTAGTNTTKMTILNNGNVGISTAAPTNLLTVGNASLYNTGVIASIGGNTYVDPVLRVSSSSNINGSGPHLHLMEDNAVRYGFDTWYDSGSNKLMIDSYQGSTPTNTMAITSAGYIGIGATSPTAKLQVDGQMDGGINLVQMSQTGTGRVIFAARDVAIAARPVASFLQSNLTGGTPAITVRQQDSTQGAISINEDGNLSTYNIQIFGTGVVKTVQDIEITDSTKGIILKSPDGTRYRIKVANGGTLTATAL